MTQRMTSSMTLLVALAAVMTFAGRSAADSSERAAVRNVPSSSARQIPSPSPTATVGPPSDLEVKPGPSAVHVIVVGFISGNAPVYARQIQVIARDAVSRTIEVGTSDDPAPHVGPFSSFYFTFTKSLPPAKEPYAIEAISLSLKLSSSSKLLIAPVPQDAGQGNALYIATQSWGGGSRPGQVFRRGFNRQGWLVFTSLDGKRRLPPEEGLVPLVIDPEIAQLRSLFYGRRAVAPGFSFTCYNAKDESASAELLPGHHVRVDGISRAAHALQWLPNDPREIGYSYPCAGPCSANKGVFVDSPIVTDFRFSPSDVKIIQPGSITRHWIFTGNCIGGFALFQSGEQMTSFLRPD